MNAIRLVLVAVLLAATSAACTSTSTITAPDGVSQDPTHGYGSGIG